MQETWLSKSENKNINNVFKDFRGVANSPNDDESTLIVGRKNKRGGVAILWHSSYDKYIEPLDFTMDWLVGVKLHLDNKVMYIFNLYLPFESPDNEDLFVDCLQQLHVVLEEVDSTCVNIVGDFNSNLHKCNASNTKQLLSFCDVFKYKLSSQLLLPPNSFPYASEAWGFRSWFDHCISSEDGFSCISEISILNDFFLSDHLPLVVELNLNCMPVLDNTVVNQPGKIDWEHASNELLNQYKVATESLASNVIVPTEVLNCRDPECQIQSHRNDLKCFYDDSVHVLLKASDVCRLKVISMQKISTDQVGLSSVQTYTSKLKMHIMTG